VAEEWAYEHDFDKVLGAEGKALRELREYLRSCLEVGVRNEGNVELGRTTWKGVVVDRLGLLGFPVPNVE